MLFKDLSMIDENMQLRHHAYLGTIGDRIAYIGPSMPEDPERFGPAYAEPRNKLLIPAFVNAHTHMPMYLLRGYAENRALSDWLNKVIFPFEAKLNAGDVYAATMLSAAELLRFGCVSATEMYYFGDSLGQAFMDSGLKGNISLACVCFDDRSYGELPVCRETLETYKNFHNAGSGRVKVDFALHAEYTSTEKAARGLAETAAEKGARIQVHAAETAGETEGCRARRGGRSPVRYLADCGIFDVPATAAHCVYVDGEDMAILKNKGVTVAACPASNLKLASGVCPAVKLSEAGVGVAIGTDSAASNNKLDMQSEMRLFSLVHKGFSGDPTAVTPAQALYAATRAGALAQGREDCGLLKEGFKADIAVFDVDQVYMRPQHHLLNNLVYSACGGDVCMTMADGRVLYEKGRFATIDVEKLTALAERSCARIQSELAGK